MIVAVDAPPDAPGATDGDLASAVPSVFRYTAPDRVETWTLRIMGERASIVVERKPGGETVYVGGAVSADGKVHVEVATQTAKLALVCTTAKLAHVGEANAARKPGAKKGQPCTFAPAKTATLDVLQCKHADFDAPMPFAPAPGVEYLLVDGCDGAYRRL